MKFKLVPILDKMEAFYNLPRTQKRFEKYLFMLQGEKKEDMILPISGYNPMGKDHVLLKIEKLRKLKAELIIEKELSKINQSLIGEGNPEIEVVLNLADDIGGAWTNYYTTDYTSKFEIKALVKRKFCTPYFWTSENYTEELIIERAKEYVYRTIYFFKEGKPIFLKNFFNQEVYVQLNQSQGIQKLKDKNYNRIEKFYLNHLNSDDYNLIFNFFYGDEASKQLSYSTYGIKKNEGFEYVKYIATEKR